MKQLDLWDILLTPESDEKEEAEHSWLLIDGNNLLYRAYYASAHRGNVALNGVLTALKMILNYEAQLKATPLVFFDEGKGFRKELYPAYKEGRAETAEDLIKQFPILRELLASAEIPVYSDTVNEADDLIASACKLLDGHKFVLSNDRDLAQIIAEDVTVIFRKQGGQDIFYTPTIFKDEFQFAPAQIKDFKALVGDKSDNIKGVEGIGEKAAHALIATYSQIENIQLPLPTHLARYQKKLHEAALKEATFFKELVTLRQDVKLNIQPYKINVVALMNNCEKYHLHSVIKILKKREITF